MRWYNCPKSTGCVSINMPISFSFYLSNGSVEAELIFSSISKFFVLYHNGQKFFRSYFSEKKVEAGIEPTTSFWILLPSTFLSSIFLNAALDISIVRKSGAPRFEPEADGWEAKTLPLCYATPRKNRAWLCHLLSAGALVFQQLLPKKVKDRVLMVNRKTLQQ